MNAAIPAVLAAAILAFAGAFFGVCIARLTWAEDLKHAQRIDDIRSKTEVYLRDQISSLERQLELKK